MAETINSYEVGAKLLEMARVTRFNPKRFKKQKMNVCRIFVSDHAVEQMQARIGESDFSQIMKALVGRKQRGQLVAINQIGLNKYYIKSTVNKKMIWICGKVDGKNFVITTVVERIKGQGRGVK